MASKRMREKEEDDRLSSLPDEVILQILSFLDMKDVVRTSILSNRWTDLWTSILNLRFDDRLFGFIDRILLNHTASKIHKFRLCLTESKNHISSSSSDIDRLTRFAVRKGVEELKIFSPLPNTFYKLPSWLFKCETLVSLKLRRCIFSNFERLSSLIKLSLKLMILKDQMLQDLLAGCHLLEDLVFEDCCVGSVLSICSLTLKHLTVQVRRPCFIVDRVEVNAPNLQILKFSNIYTPECRFKDFSSLRKAYPGVHYHPITRDSCGLSSFEVSLQNICHAKVLELSSSFIQAMSPTPRLKDWKSYILKTKCLILPTRLHRFEFPYMGFLLWSPPSLDTLIINLISHDIDNVYGSNDKDGQTCKTGFDEREYCESLTSTFPCLLPCLKSIKITNFIRRAGNSFADYEKEINLVRFLLKNDRVLEKVTIHVSPYHPFIMKIEEWQRIMLKVTQRLISIPRASPHVDVSFLYE